MLLKKRIYIVIVFLLACIAAVTAGYLYKKNNITEHIVYGNTADYPKLSLKQLTNMASYIVNAKVADIGETVNHKVSVSLTGNQDDTEKDLYTPVTPVTLEIQAALKGKCNSGRIVYYEYGGVTESYVQAPDGYSMEKGMEVILFLNNDGFNWGAQSIFPVNDNYVILNSMALEYIDNKEVSVIDKNNIETCIRKQLDTQEVSVMGKEKFISVINSLID